MLWLSTMEQQRYQAVMAVQDGWKVTEVADRLACRASPCTTSTRTLPKRLSRLDQGQNRR